ncbi:MAG TPA: hypothetical protein VIX17_15915 [Pyrinomonadaceae bacterium]
MKFQKVLAEPNWFQALFINFAIPNSAMAAEGKVDPAASTGETKGNEASP